MDKFYSNGKLLITGEYAVLDGALALAVPTVYGQWMEVEETSDKKISWKSLDCDGNLWLESAFELEGNKLKNITIQKNNKQKELNFRLHQILVEAFRMEPGALSRAKGFKITTKLDFPRNWGLGTSSTLINNIALWLGTDPYELLAKTFGGSGYDIAAAQNDHPITYQLTKDRRQVLSNSFDPPFKDKLFFVHLDKKQNSREAIAHYKQQSKALLEQNLEKINNITHSFIACKTLAEFEILIDLHETLISKLIKLPKVKSSLFPDYPGALKSLGAWGGDFMLATGDREDQKYFMDQNYTTIIPYNSMVLNSIK